MTRLLIRYVGVIPIVLLVLQLLPIRFPQWNLCCISKYMVKQARIGLKIEPCLLYLWSLQVHLCCYRCGLDTHILPIVFNIKGGVVSMMWRCNPISFWACVFVIFFLWSSLNHTLINYKGPIKKSIQSSLHTLIVDSWIEKALHQIRRMLATHSLLSSLGYHSPKTPIQIHTLNEEFPMVGIISRSLQGCLELWDLKLGSHFLASSI